MKRKLSFITNSSSASFILYVTSGARNLEDFKEIFKDYLNSYFASRKFIFSREYNIKDYKKWTDDQIDSIISTISHKVANIYIVEGFTSMLNEIVDDLPGWMKKLIIEMATGRTILGIDKVSLEIQSDHGY